MQKFAAFVTFLRQYWHLFFVSAPIVAFWYFAMPSCIVWFFIDRFYLVWIFKHHLTDDYVNQQIGIGLLVALGYTLLTSFVVFLCWVFFSRNFDMEFTKSSVATLVIGSLLVGSSVPGGYFLTVHWTVGCALGVSLLLLETQRMRVLAMTY